MTSKLYSIELLGLEGCLVEIEVDKLGGIPNFIIVGLPDAAVKEASERVRSAIKNSDYIFPRSKIVVNLAPAHLRKVGARYDLAIALGILAMEGLIDQMVFRDTMIIGELALDGSLRPVTGILASVDFAKRIGTKRILLPAANAREAALLNGIKILPAHTLKEAVLLIQDQLCPLPVVADYQIDERKVAVDMALIQGQAQAKRALEVAAAGGHNVIMSGPPGAGKTLLAQALAGILPSMSEEEILEVTKIYSIAGLLPKSQPLVPHRPFRSVHHTASPVSIIGGGDIPRPGEISLAHRGVLFMDEIAEFPPSALDVLRQPLESRCITVSRARGSFTFPAQFMLVAAMNPCPCGYFNVANPKSKRCSCTYLQMRQYQKRLSGPLLDRIDITLHVQPVPHEKMIGKEEGENSITVRKRVENAVLIQRERFKDQPIHFNAEMQNKEIERYCQVSLKSKAILVDAMTKLSLSARGYHRILKLARTVADLERAEMIETPHVTEAIQYRKILGNKN